MHLWIILTWNDLGDLYLVHKICVCSFCFTSSVSSVATVEKQPSYPQEESSFSNWRYLEKKVAQLLCWKSASAVLYNRKSSDIQKYHWSGYLQIGLHFKFRWSSRKGNCVCEAHTLPAACRCCWIILAHVFNSIIRFSVFVFKLKCHFYIRLVDIRSKNYNKASAIDVFMQFIIAC